MKHRNKFLKYYMVSMADEGGDETGDGGDVTDSGAGGGGDTPDNTDSGDTGDDQGVQGYWPDDWQQRLAGEDEKLAKRFGRYASPEDMAKALVAAQNRISSGELKSALPEKPTDEELATWRKDNGIPEKPEGYKFDGLVIGDEDKPFADEFLKVAHDRNMTPDQAKATLEWYYQDREAQAQARQEMDAEQKQAALDELNVEWGGSFRRNVNMVENLLSKFPESVRDGIKSARLPDGTGIFNHPDVMRAFANLALEVNPAGTLTPVDGDPAKGVEEEIETIEKFMREDRKAYNKDEKKQARLLELYGIREKLQQRKAG